LVVTVRGECPLWCIYGKAVYCATHTVIETPTFVHDCRNLTEDERLAIAAQIAADPQLGDVTKGTGGARKRRFPGRGKGTRAAAIGPSLVARPTMFRCYC